MLLACILFPAMLQAQGHSKLNLDLAVKLGANFTNIDGKYWVNGYKANLLAGAYAALNGPRIGLQIEGLFTQATYITGKGFSDLYKDFYQTGKDSIKTGSFRVNYFNIPVLLNIKLMSRVWIQLGPQYSGVVTVKDVNGLMNDAGKLFKNGTVSGVGGLQINLPLNISLSGRYVFGLSDINNNYDYTKNQSNIEDNWKQRTLQVALSYTIF